MPILKIGTGAARSVLNLDLVLIRLAFHAEEAGAPVLTYHRNLLLHGALTPRQRVCVHGVQPGLQALLLSSASGVAPIAHRRRIGHRSWRGRRSGHRKRAPHSHSLVRCGLSSHRGFRYGGVVQTLLNFTPIQIFTQLFCRFCGSYPEKP